MLRNYAHWRTHVIPLALFTALALTMAACPADGDDPDAADSPENSETPAEAAEDRDGPTIVVGSFNFPESVVLAEIYAQALERNGYDVRTRLDLGARELIIPELEAGEISMLPEYLGSALAVGFEGEATADEDETLERLREELDERGLVALEPAPGMNTNVFVVTQSYADENSLATISDLGDVDSTIVFGGPPECEERSTCLGGLREVYGLDEIEFEVLQEAATRIASLEQGRIHLALLFSTMPVIAERGFIALEDDEGIVPVENIVPVFNADILAEYGTDLEDLVDSISERITTDVLMGLNHRIEVEAQDPRDVARQWLEDEGLLD